MVLKVLGKQMSTFEFFFQDFAGKDKAPESFMISVLTNLDSRLFDKGSVLIEENGKVEDLIVAGEGKLKLYGFYDHRGERHKMHIVNLPVCSWYGDFQILLDLESSFQLEAGSSKKNSSYGANIVQVYKLKGDTLLELAQDYPLFRRFLVVRATRRRSQFLQVFEEMK